MSCLLSEKTWLLVAGAVVLGVLLLASYGDAEVGLLAAFFTVVGDLLALLALGKAACADA